MRKIPPPYTDPAPLFRHGGIAPADRAKLLDFSASVNPLGPPASVLQAIRAALPGIAHYPDPHCRELTEKLAALHAVAPEQIVIGNGSNELIYASARAFRPRRVAIAEPTYTEYLRASLLVGAQVEHWLAEGDDFALEPFDPEGADLVWLCNPNNPTGGLWPQASRSLAPWIQAHPASCFVVDEAFLSCCGGDLPVADYTLVQHLAACENLVVLRSLTKQFALPGLRLGYAITSPARAVRLRAELPPWSVNLLAQVAGIAALADREYPRKTEEWFREAASPFATSLARCGQLIPSRATFVLARLERWTATQVNSRMRERGLLVRDASNFVGLDDRYLRVAVKTRDANERLVCALAEILAGEPCPAP
ncbi:MAG: pyridoxal phosphate-dependent class II aminotransferase [Planctomycetia bacterium]|nr:pyridoxal phosphate-dependent class II aminotransferase [Planctomycetia bacterium]